MTDSETEPGSREDKRARVRRAAAVWSNGATRPGKPAAETEPAAEAEPAAPPAAEEATSTEPEVTPTPSQTDTEPPDASTAAGSSPGEATDGAAHDVPTPPPPTPAPPPSDAPASAPPASDPPAEAAAPAKTRATTSTTTSTGTDTKKAASTRDPDATRQQVKGAVDNVRNRIGSIVWIIAVLCALVLAAAALLVALGANETNDIVMWVKERANNLDGPFHDLFTFDGRNRKDNRTRTLLVNNGVAAIAYLVVGKIAERLIKP